MKIMKKNASLLVEFLLFLLGIAFICWVNFVYDISSAYQTLFFVSLLAVCAGIYYLFPGKVNTIVFLISTSLYYVYILAQNVYFSAFGQYFRLSMVFSMKNEIENSVDSIMEFIHTEYFYPLIVVLLVSIATLFLYCVNHKPALKYRFRLLIAALCFGVSFLCYGQAKGMIDETRDSVDKFMVYKTDYYLYNSIPSTTQFCNEFGFSGMLVREIESVVQKNQLFNSSEVVEEYMKKRESYSQNQMTGLFSGKSLLMIQAESLMNIAIDEFLTPTLYKMMNEGIVVDGYCSPLLNGSTSSTEFMANLSLYPITEDGFNPSLKYMNNTHASTLANLFNKAGYKSYAFHNNYGEFYSRDIIMPNYGYNFYDSYALGVESQVSDSTYFEVAKWILLEKEKFFAYWITYNGHQPYDFNQNPEIAQYIPLVQERYPEMSEDYVSYMAKTMDLDRTIENFLYNLKDNGKAEDVVIIVFGDHYAKGLVDEEEVKNALLAMNRSSDNDSISKATDTPLLIYSLSLNESVYYHKTSNTIDLMPTISNLWGFDLDESTVLGYDIFSDSYDGFYYNETETYMTDSFNYDYVRDRIVSSNNISEEDVYEEVNRIIERFNISKLILESDYFGTNR